MSYRRKRIKTKIGEFEQEGNGAWLCYYDYDNRDLEIIVKDDNGKPSDVQINTFIKLLPKLPDYELKCRKYIADIEDHDFDGLFFDCEYDFKLAFSWGNGEWGRSVFIDFLNDKIVNSYVVSD